jgi:hypothetical protein
VVLAFNNNVRRDRPALKINALNHRNPFSVARLGQLKLAFSVKIYNNHRCGNLTHHKASFVKVINVGIGDPVLRDRVAHKVKPALNKLWIFAQDP